MRFLRVFLAWPYDGELVEQNLALKVKDLKTPRVEKQPFTNVALRELLKAATTPRDKAIVAVLMDTGVRASELRTLRRDAVILDQGLLLVQGKRQKQCIVPISPKTNLIPMKLTSKSTSERVFIGKKGSLTTNGLPQALYRIGAKDEAENVHPHKSRHTFALSFIRHKGDSFTLQRLLGHATLHMTSHYVSMQTENQRCSHALAGPLAKLLRD